MKTNKIKFIIEVITSSRDRNGNCYHYATITKTENGESISGMVGGSSNPSCHLRELGIEFDEMKTIEAVLPIRQANRHFKDADPYLDKEKIAEFAGIHVWHLTKGGITTLCNRDGDKLNVSRYNTTLACGVWCNDCRRIYATEKRETMLKNYVPGPFDSTEITAKAMLERED